MPTSTAMEADSQEIQVQSREGWAQYADCKDMFRFRDLGTLEKTRQPFDNVRGLEPLLVAPPGVQSSFSSPSSLCYDPKTPVDIQCPPRSLDDLYLENPEKKLQVSIDPTTMNIAAGVVLHAATESGYQWLSKWCPHMEFHEVFESISIKGGGGELADKKYNVPSHAIDTQSMKTTPATTLVELYRECQDIRSKGSGNVGFPKLLKLIDQCTIFVSALKDSERKKLLKNMRFEFQWIPIALDKEKFRILNEARGNLEALNRQLNCGAADIKVDVHDLNCKRKEGENDILNTITANFNIHRNAFESLILKKLEVLLASTASSPPKSN
ncbi:hypothetical protein GGR51DRAFT_104586 [Nemania sp. FL0031]|nr:hypothetical protein GGR51DRAFT_104586 [Nemania sp. FL0031]